MSDMVKLFADLFDLADIMWYRRK